MVAKKKGVDTDAMQKYKEEHQKGGDFLSFDEGETLVYVHPPCRDDDEYEPTAGLNFVPVGVHYAVGKSNAMVVSLDPEANPIIDHPFVKAELKKKKVRLTGECPVKNAIEGGELSNDEADEARLQTRYLWGMTPIGFRKMNKGPWVPLSNKPGIAMIGKSINEGLMDLFTEHGDITDPDDAILVKIRRTGSGRMGTKYEVKPDPETLKTHKVLSKKERALLIKALGDDCDLFRVTANMIKGPAEVQALLDGVKVSKDDDEEDDEEELDAKPAKAAKKKGKKPAPVEEEDDDEEEEDEDEPPPRKAKKAAKKPEPEEDEDDEEDEAPPPPKVKAGKKAAKKPEPEEEDEDEEEDEPPPKKASKKAAAKPADDEEDEDEAEEEDDEPPPRKASKKAAAKPADDEEEDEEEEADDDEEDEEEPPPRKEAKKASKKPAKPADDEDEEDDDEEEDEEEEKPAKSAKASKKPADDDDDDGLDELEKELDDAEDEDDDEDEEEPPPRKAAKK